LRERDLVQLAAGRQAVVEDLLAQRGRGLVALPEHHEGGDDLSADEDVAEFYTPFNHKNWEEVVTWIRRFGASGDAAIVTTVSGDANIYFYRELGRQGITVESLPAMTLSIGEGELPAIAGLRWPATSPPGAICTRSTAPRTKLSSLPGGVSATRPMS